MIAKQFNDESVCHYVAGEMRIKLLKKGQKTSRRIVATRVSNTTWSKRTIPATRWLISIRIYDYNY